MATALSIIIPANNEAGHIGACLEAVSASDPLPGGEAVQVIVVANGCTDETAALAAGFETHFAGRGWHLDVIELPKGGKLAALQAGEDMATSRALAYLDADVVVARELVAQTAAALRDASPRYVSGNVILMRAKSRTTRAYGRFYKQVPFMRQVAPGCGFFAMNAAGRARWAAWPDIISDDTFARLNFAENERVQVDARYEWPLVEGLRNLIRVRRRQNAGVDEIEDRFPELIGNDAKGGLEKVGLSKLLRQRPLALLFTGLLLWWCV